MTDSYERHLRELQDRALREAQEAARRAREADELARILRRQQEEADRIRRITDDEDRRISDADLKFARKREDEEKERLAQEMKDLVDDMMRDAFWRNLANRK
tara:strand:- start:203 stop:508 length:306 start_codon:yes stop_codon:yes gene_type:complete